MTYFESVEVWDAATRAAVSDIVIDLAPFDHREVFGLRPEGDAPIDLMIDIAKILADGRLLFGFYAVKVVDKQNVPFALGLAYRGNVPNVAELAFLGRPGYRRDLPEVFDFLRTLYDVHCDQGGIQECTIAQVPVLKSPAMRRRLQELGGVAAFEYGKIGRLNQEYEQFIWRFI